MTYLEMVNNVLRRLRERTVSTVTVNDYSQLIGIMVNDAKREVENSWDWSQLRTDIAVATVAGTDTYVLDTSLNRITVKDIWNDTNDYYLEQRPSDWIREQLKTNGAQSGEPRYFCYTDVATDGDVQLQFYPKPDDVYNLSVRAVLREGDLSANTDATLLPNQPIVLLAYAKAIDERGEDAGNQSSAAYGLAMKSLSDHISMDANRYPEELTWREV